MTRRLLPLLMLCAVVLAPAVAQANCSGPTGIAGTILTGGIGHDTFAFPNLMGHDEVTNFGIAKDTLQFNASLFANFSAAMVAATQVGANTVFTIDTNDTVTLDNVVRSSLTAGNFHFS